MGAGGKKVMGTHRKERDGNEGGGGQWLKKFKFAERRERLMEMAWTQYHRTRVSASENRGPWSEVPGKKW